MRGQALFGESRLPTLAQYDPHNRFFEGHEGTQLFSGDSGVPLIRYHIADEGGVVSYDDMLAFRARQSALRRPRPRGPPHAVRLRLRPLPFHGFVFRGEHLPGKRHGWPRAGRCQRWLTGEFVLEVLEDADRDRHLGVTVELAPGQEARR